MHSKLIIAAGVAIVGAAFGATNTSRAATPAELHSNQCVATIATPIVAGSSSQEVTVSLSEDMNDSVSVDIAPESNLKVSRITRDMGSKMVKLEVDATNGSPGRWAVTLNGKTTVCKGEVRVSARS